MSNQRSGNWKPAAMSSGASISLLELKQFASSCQELLERRGDSESAFYFEQIVDWIQTNPNKGFGCASKVLGL